ncbi:MAG TPA: heavy metal-associated domain-containing protein [Segetibacter sp.]|jgi:copper chaperone CopZ
MKKILIIISSLLVMQANAQFKEATLVASGLTCAMCSNAIYKSLQKLPFAGQIKSNIKESSFTISFKENTIADFDAIKKAVEAAGFSVANLKVKANFDDSKINNDTHLDMQGKTLHFLNVKSQTLKGEHTFKVVDKKFTSDKEYKKYAASTKMECVKSGTMESCCNKAGSEEGKRIYHVTI